MILFSLNCKITENNQWSLFIDPSNFKSSHFLSFTLKKTTKYYFFTEPTFHQPIKKFDPIIPWFFWILNWKDRTTKVLRNVPEKQLDPLPCGENSQRQSFSKPNNATLAYLFLKINGKDSVLNGKYQVHE